MAAALRCPFCHDQLPADPPLRCAACDAAHHVECFLEQGGCAATACGGARSKLGRQQLELDALRALAADPPRLNALAARSRRTSRPALWSMALLLALFGAVLGSLTAGALVELGSGRVEMVSWWPAIVGALVGLAVAWWFMLRESDLPSRHSVHRGAQEHFDAILGLWRYDDMLGNMFPASNSLGPLDAVLERNAPDRATAAAAPPERCPSCEGRLRDPGEEGEPLSFCFHCGADLTEPPVRIREGVQIEGDPSSEGEPRPRIEVREVDPELPVTGPDLLEASADSADRADEAGTRGEDPKLEPSEGPPAAEDAGEGPNAAAPPTHRATE